jgi:two-component system OmpR family sensor kinase
LLAILMASLGTFVVIRLRADLIDGVDSTLATRASQIALGLRGPGEGEFQDVSDAALQQLPGSESAAQLLDPSGTVLERSGDVAAATSMIGPEDLLAIRRGEPVHRTVTLGSDAEPFRVLALRLPSSPERIVVAATSLDTVDASVGRLTTLLLLAGPGLLLVAGVGGWWLARAALAPVSRITQTAGEIGIEHLDERVDVPATSDEIHDLAVTMNGMLERLQRGVAEQRRFVADASHELRTPLAAVRAYAELFTRGAADRPDDLERSMHGISRESERMSLLVEDLLLLAHLDEGRPFESEPVELDEVVAEAVETARTLEPDRPLEVELEPTVVAGDHDRLRQVVDNLLSNVRSHTPVDAPLRVGLAHDDGAAVLTVADSGPGMDEEQLTHVFERFYRADPSRARASGGAGLGLAIVAAVVESHGGKVEAESSPGEGTLFRVRLPLERS